MNYMKTIFDLWQLKRNEKKIAGEITPLSAFPVMDKLVLMSQGALWNMTMPEIIKFLIHDPRIVYVEAA